MNGNWFAQQHRLPIAVVSYGFLYFLSWEGELGQFFISWGEVVLSWGMGSLVWGGGGGGELPLHLPWINPSARQLLCNDHNNVHAIYLYSMTDMQGYYKPACSDPPQTIPSELGFRAGIGE